MTNPLSIIITQSRSFRHMHNNAAIKELTLVVLPERKFGLMYGLPSLAGKDSMGGGLPEVNHKMLLQMGANL